MNESDDCAVASRETAAAPFAKRSAPRREPRAGEGDGDRPAFVGAEPPRSCLDVAVEVGQIVAGKYAIERILARGGGGVVVRARHLRLLEPCAIKFMLGEAMFCPTTRERFLREARALARLKSDHVVKVFDVGELDPETPYMVLEYLDGVDLEKHVARRGPLPISEAGRYVVEICAAVAEAHELGIVHRDLKPANVFLARRADGTTRVKLLDFGISKVLRDPGTADHVTTLDGTILGSPPFMAPEQVRGGRVDGRTDIWAIGVMLYYLLTGHLPFGGEGLLATFTSILSRVPVPPSRHVAALPPEIERIILQCLAKDPARRPASASEVAVAIAPFAETGGPLAGSAEGMPPELDASRALRAASPTLQAEEGANACSTAPSAIDAAPLAAEPGRPRRAWRRPAALVACAAAAVVVLTVASSRRAPAHAPLAAPRAAAPTAPAATPTNAAPPPPAPAAPPAPVAAADPAPPPPPAAPPPARDAPAAAPPPKAPAAPPASPWPGFHLSNRH